MGRIVVLCLLLTAAVLGGAVYITLKSSHAIRGSVASQLENKFKNYLSQLPDSGQLELERSTEVESFGADNITINYRYYLDTKKPWALELHDKTIIVLAPSIEHVASTQSKGAREIALYKKYSAQIDEIATKRLAEVFEKTRPKVSDLLSRWLEFQFPKEKNIAVKVQFANEPNKP